ncbi:MAG TPA: glycosyltransferase family 39 protein [Acidimicrobiales bacterium]|jgi:4-amino-4-deoxy-L-arabinose transferase-like glycosyltransferase|nr:glycosyltransferase family 39 protein [Acidimicrobiales bacterium]
MIRRGRHSSGLYWPWIGLWTAVGLGIRLGSVFGRPNRVAGGDAYYSHNAAALLVAGQGFINPFRYFPHHLHHHVQTASWPPLFVFILAAATVVGAKSFFAQRIWCCIIGASAVVLCGLVGREIGGRRVGIITAFLVAVYPNIWMSNELALSETLSPVLVALVLLAAYKFWKRPTLWNVLWLGGSIGLAALGRDELSLLAVFILVPLVLLAKTLSWWRRIAFVGLALLTALVLVMPWVGYNMSRFTDPVYISSGFGVTLASANCDQTFNGMFEGYWSLECAEIAARKAETKPHADESVQSDELESYALHYIRGHENRLIPVELAKLGRGFGFFHPFEQIELDERVETRPYHWALLGLYMYWALLALSVGGVVLLRRRRVPVFPLLAIGLDVAISMAVTFGQTRYRTTFEVSLVLLASVQLEWFWSRVRPRRGAVVRGDHGDDDDDDDDDSDDGHDDSPAEDVRALVDDDTDDAPDEDRSAEVAVPAPAG